MVSRIMRLWKFLRSVTGDDAYEQYLLHWRHCHSGKDGEPMSRETFFRAEIERRWNGIKRCC